MVPSLLRTCCLRRVAFALTVAAVMVGCRIAAAHAAVASAYNVVPLTFENVRCIQQVGAMDAQGGVVGVADFVTLPFSGPSSGLSAFVWRNGVFTPLPPFTGFDPSTTFASGPGCSGVGATQASGIDPSGSVVVGTGVSADVKAPPLIASEWTNGVGPLALGSLCAPMPMNVPLSQAFAINDAGDVVGNSRTQDFCDGSIGNGIVPNAAFLRHGAEMGAIAEAGGAGNLASGEIDAVAINVHDQVVVTDDNAGADNTLPTAYLWQPSPGASVFPGTLAPLSVFPFGSSSLRIDALPSSQLGATTLGTSFVLNDAGVVVGVRMPLDAAFVPAYSQNGGPAVVLPTANGLPQGAANGINGNGDVVGSSFDVGTGHQIATLWPGAGGVPGADAMDLNTLIPSDAGITLYEAVGINDEGDILAYGAAMGSPPGLFELTTGVRHVRIAFDPETVAGSGAGLVRTSVTVTDDKQQPVAHQKVFLDPPPAAHPRALVCGPGGRLYPSRLTDGSFVGLKFPRTTDASGRIDVQVYTGTESGDWVLDAFEPGHDGMADGSDLRSFPITGQLATTLPAGLLDRLRGFYSAQHDLAIDVGTDLFITPKTNQPLLLAWLDLHAAQLTDVDWGPVRSADGATAGVVFYPHGRNADDLLSHLQNGTPLAPTAAAVLAVLDTEVACQQIVDQVLHPDQATKLADPPLLAAWESAHGPAQRGLVADYAGSEFTYFGFPRPPAIRGVVDTQFAATCLITDPNVYSVRVGSPVNLLFHDASGAAFGVDAQGQMVADLPGIVTRDDANHVDGYFVPAADYTVDVQGTGDGPATVAFFTPKGVRTYTLNATPAQGGSVKLHHDAVAGSFTFGGQKARAVKGVPLSLAGLPPALHAKTATQLVLTLTDALHAPAGSVAVSVSGDGISRHGSTDAQGTVTFAVVPKRPGKVTVKASGPGYLKLKRTVTVGS